MHGSSIMLPFSSSQKLMNMKGSVSLIQVYYVMNHLRGAIRELLRVKERERESSFFELNTDGVCYPRPQPVQQ